MNHINVLGGRECLIASWLRRSIIIVAIIMTIMQVEESVPDCKLVEKEQCRSIAEEQCKQVKHDHQHY